MALTPRPPIITIMGHVDHGKTTLLDYLRKSRITAGEAGGITQHIGAYQVEHKGRKLTFIDTPGHAAFKAMRERGAKVTDIVILVVAANDGVKPQTIESIRHIKEAKAPVLVAINKVDLPNVYPDVVKGELTEHDIKVQGFGGETEVVEISALKGTGIDKLLDTLLAMTDLQEITADATAPLQAVVIEGFKDSRRGSVASVIVKQGTLSTRQTVYVDGIEGRVRSLTSDLGQQLTSVGPGQPAEILGLPSVPAVGSVMTDQPPTASSTPDTSSSENQTTESDPAVADYTALFSDQPKIKLIIKSDVEGTLEAILDHLTDDNVTLIDCGVGEISEADVTLAQSTDATIIAFHTRVPGRIKTLAKQSGVRIKTYDVIYHLIEDFQKQILKLMEPTIDEKVTGEAEILQIFDIRGERIAGVKVKTGEIKKTDLLHLKRSDGIIANPVIKSMLHGKEEISVVKAKNEAGLTFKNKKLDFVVGDVLVAYTLVDEE